MVNISFTAPGAIAPIAAGVSPVSGPPPTVAVQPTPWVLNLAPGIYVLALAGNGTAGTDVTVNITGATVLQPTPPTFTIGGAPGTVRGIVDHVFFQV